MPKLEPFLLGKLEHAATHFGITPSALFAIFIGDAFGYRSPWDPQEVFDYQEAGLDLAAAKAAAAGQPLPFPAILRLGTKVSVHLDREVADKFNAACEDAGVNYIDNLRRVLAAGAGVSTFKQLREIEQGSALFDVRKAS